jgi:stearoyl-CoA desaturase (delta-9 desaturase)
MDRHPENLNKLGSINWTTAITMVIFHAGAVAALFMLTWQAVAVSVVLAWVAGSPGIGMGFHRLLTHRGYKTPKFMEYLMTILGTLTLEGGQIDWVVTHRIHHAHTDAPGDPHTPRDGGWWAHMGWILRVVLGAGLFWFGGWSMLFCGIFLRVVVGLHATWFVNSATHMWGTRRFDSADDSRNSWWVALLTWGEGWHNNHHAHPRAARHGLTWYEIDFNWYGIRALQLVGLASDIKLISPATIREAAQAAARPEVQGLRRAA